MDAIEHQRNHGVVCWRSSRELAEHRNEDPDDESTNHQVETTVQTVDQGIKDEDPSWIQRNNHDYGNDNDGGIGNFLELFYF